MGCSDPTPREGGGRGGSEHLLHPCSLGAAAWYSYLLFMLTLALMMTSSYSKGPGTTPVWHAYYYWYATALKRNFDKTGNTTLLKEVLPAYKLQFLTFAAGTAPGEQLVVSIDQQGSQCLYNVPGADAGEQTPPRPP